jgi:hypothetical protein
MNRTNLILITGLALLATPSLAVEPAKAPAKAEAKPAVPEPDAKAAVKDDHVTWQLGPLHVLSPGTKKQLKEGTMTEGYTVTAPAKAMGPASVSDGTFTMTFGAFTPVKDMPKQPKGFWYVRGNWRLVQSGAKAPAKGRHNSEALQGFLLAQLPFDPTTGKGGYALAAKTPKGNAWGGWKKIEGTINVDEKLEGTLYLKLE